MNFVTAHKDGSTLRVGEHVLAVEGKAAEVIQDLDDGAESGSASARNISSLAAGRRTVRCGSRPRPRSSSSWATRN